MKFCFLIKRTLKKSNLLLTLIIIIGSFGNSLAQLTNVSPYSRYGIGDIQFGTFITQQTMGGVSSAYQSPYRINFNNPASYSSIAAATFETGGFAESIFLKTNQKNDAASNSSIGYLGIGFPLIKEKAGLSFGLVPLSQVGYSIESSQSVDSIGSIKYTYNGTGGINRAYVGIGYKISPSFSIGFNAAYLFGNLSRYRSIEFPKGTNYFNTRNTNDLTVNDVYFNFGAQYKKGFNEKTSLVVGSNISLESNINNKSTILSENYSLSSINSPIIKDTSQFFKTKNSDLVLPFMYSFGVMLYSEKKWVAGVDFSMQNWADIEGSSPQTENSYQINSGIQYTPKPDVFAAKYVEKMNYRMGLRYNHSYLNLNNTNITDYGISVGIGLPVRKGFAEMSMINIGIEAGQRGTTDNALLKETHIKFLFGVVINEEWFKRRKFE